VNLDVGIELRFLWALNSLLIILLGWFIRSWINGLERQISKKADSGTIEKDISRLNLLFRHKHPIYKDREKTGEVILE
jgi:hypothetical protein